MFGCRLKSGILHIYIKPLHGHSGRIGINHRYSRRIGEAPQAVPAVSKQIAHRGRRIGGRGYLNHPFAAVARVFHHHACVGSHSYTVIVELNAGVGLSSSNRFEPRLAVHHKHIVIVFLRHELAVAVCAFLGEAPLASGFVKTHFVELAREGHALYALAPGEQRVGKPVVGRTLAHEPCLAVGKRIDLAQLKRFLRTLCTVFPGICVYHGRNIDVLAYMAVEEIHAVSVSNSPQIAVSAVCDVLQVVRGQNGIARHIAEGGEPISVITRQAVPRNHPCEVVRGMYKSGDDTCGQSIFRAEHAYVTPWLCRSRRAIQRYQQQGRYISDKGFH